MSSNPQSLTQKHNSLVTVYLSVFYLLMLNIFSCIFESHTLEEYTLRVHFSFMRAAITKLTPSAQPQTYCKSARPRTLSRNQTVLFNRQSLFRVTVINISGVFNIINCLRFPGLNITFSILSYSYSIIQKNNFVSIQA